MRSVVRTAWVLAALLGVAVALSACGSSSVSDPTKLEGTWVLESFGGTTQLTPADPDVTSELAMKAGKATGTGGVNTFSTTYEAKDNGSLKFGKIASTMMAGEPAAMEQEAAFFKALENTRNYEFNEGRLVFGDLGNNTVMVLVAK